MFRVRRPWILLPVALVGGLLAFQLLGSLPARQPAGSPASTLGASGRPSVGGGTSSPRASSVALPSPTADGATSSDRKPPNIILVMVDDLAEMDLRVWNRLPNIRQQFIENGVRFDNYYGNDPLCCPGRSNLLTGLYTDHHGVWKNDARLLDPSVTLATRLQSVGYSTFISGKYLNFTQRLANKLPPGWDHAAIMSGGYYRYQSWTDNVPEDHGARPADYSTDVFTAHAVQYIRDAPAEEPIFGFITPFAVHDGADANGFRDVYQPAAAPRYKGDPRCAGIPRWRPANYNEADTSDKPAYIRALRPFRSAFGISYVKGWPLKTMCEALLSVDDEFARIRSELAADGRLANTLFILTGDNGMGFGQHRWAKKGVPYATALPLFVSWSPGSTWTLSGVNHTILENVDWAPTLCELAGCRMGPYPNGQAEPDGQSFLGLIAPSISSSVPVRTAIYMEHRSGGHPKWREIITTPSNPLGLWAFVRYSTGERELYRLSPTTCPDWSPGQPADPCYLTNLANDSRWARVKAQLAKELRTMIVNPLPSVP
jgi:N-acetylglucosamine-6-sulfatase